jgi:DNA polymerase-3 subunit epsilon/oligoribonuclease
LDPYCHKLLEIAFKVVDIPSGKVNASYQAIIKHPIDVWEMRDPASVEFNGFTWEKMQQGKEMQEVRREIIALFQHLRIERGKAVYICQNPAFDRNFFAQLIDVYTQEELHWPYHWLDLASMFWALQVKTLHENRLPFPLEMNLSKNSIAQHFQLPIEATPHSALNGVDHLLLCYRAVVGFDQPVFSEEEQARA